MKTQIIQLSQNEDHISIRDKMSWSKANRILLVWPEQGRALSRQLDLKLVLRYAASLGAQLALVTIDPEVGFFAQQLGIPVYASPRQAQDAVWVNHNPTELKIAGKAQPLNLIGLREASHTVTPAWMEHPTTRFFCLGMCVLALFILGIVILPGAKIILLPQLENQSMVFNLIADPTTNSINYSTGSLPSYYQDSIIEGRDTVVATGSVTIPDKIATGSLQFTNESDQAIKIPAGTTVSTLGVDPVRFITTSATDIDLEPGNLVTLSARAIKPGLSGNILPNRLVTIDGLSGLGLSVTNPQATLGGTETSVPSPTDEDFNQLRQRLLSKLMLEALAQLNSILPADDILITPTTASIEILAETSFPAVGEPGNQLELSLRLKVHTQVVSRAIVQNLINPVMNSYTPPGYSPLAGTLEIIQTSNPTFDQVGKAYWTVRVSRKLQAAIPPQQVAALIRGLTPTQASQRLSSVLPLARQAQFVLSPSWWPILPFVTMRIQITQSGVQ